MKKDIYKKFTLELDGLKEKDSFRSFKPYSEKENKYINISGKKYLNLSSNDYLGLSSNKEIIKEFYVTNKFDEKCLKFRLGSASSRLLTGDSFLHTELESELKKLYSREVLTFNSGYHANISIIPAIASRSDLILMDKLCHASIIDGSRLSFAKSLNFNHLNYENLEDLLKRHRDKYENVMIVSESLFSMDGDIADITKLVKLKKKYNCILYIDEAHSVGVYGENGLGLCEEEGLINEIDFIIGTFGKALGSYGAFAVTSRMFKEYLVNKARSLIFTTALPPIIINWSTFIIKKLLGLTAERQKLFEITKELRRLFQEKGLEVIGSSHIIPVIIGLNDKTLKVADRLKEKGFYCLPIRPPTVPEGTSRIRISLTSNMNIDDIIKIPQIISNALKSD
ncbi:MAG: aminotransferase class I/II-fold pyridoxal phosphate-dependent enzyme [Candidatus Delongbacteria bacterium]|nr:aminotransferase class I/II-fold pyridoxal phosphate-dependent enzyme [Candidatus Delongbacteria bacterium]